MIYFDNAATTLVKPDTVIDAVTDAMRHLGNSGRAAHGAALDASRTIYTARKRLAELFNAKSPSQIAFTANATMSLNTAIKGTAGPGDHIITTVMEHNSVLRPVYQLQDAGTEVTFAGCDEKGVLNCEEIYSSVRKDTRCIVTTHGSNLTGNVNDIKEIGKFARENGIIYIVDASQTAGIWDIDVQDMNIDILCFTGHKGLYGPQGTGGIYVREGIDVKPLLTGGSGTESYSRYHPCRMPQALEAGTLNGHGIAGLGAGVLYVLENMEYIRKRALKLAGKFQKAVSEIPGVRTYGDFTAEKRCPIVSLSVGDYDSSEISDELSYTYGIQTRPGAHCAPLMHKALGTQDKGLVRFSFSSFNTEDEIETAVKALKVTAGADDGKNS